MQIEDLKPTATPIDDTARPKASQVVARAKRARQQDTPITLARTIPTRQLVPFGVGAIVLIAAIFATRQSFERTPLAITPVATSAPAQAFDKQPQEATSAPTSAPQPTSVPTFTAVPTEAALTVPVEPAQSGRGLTLAVDSAVATHEPPAAPEPSYIANVGAQAPHTFRSGATGPCDGACAVVPPAPSAMLEVIGQQAPHKVR